jgi:hypothetical protein
MNKGIKKLASAKAEKYGGEDRAEYRRGRGAKRYRTERVSQTETPEMGAYTPWYGRDSEGAALSGTDPATYNADNKGLSATYGRMVREQERSQTAMGYPAERAKKDAISYINQYRDMVVKPSSARILGKNKAKQLENKAWNRAASGSGVADGAWKKTARKGLSSFRRGGVSRAAGKQNYRNWKLDLGED